MQRARPTWQDAKPPERDVLRLFWHVQLIVETIQLALEELAVTANVQESPMEPIVQPFFVHRTLTQPQTQLVQTFKPIARALVRAALTRCLRAPHIKSLIWLVHLEKEVRDRANRPRLPTPIVQPAHVQMRLRNRQQDAQPL